MIKKFDKIKFEDYKNVYKYLFIENDINIILLEGELGSGKTTFVQFIAKELNIIQKVLSPTFSIINEYKSESGMSVYHFDLFRLNSKNELLDLGFNEYLDSGNLCLIEWPEICEEFLKERYIKIIFKIDEDLTRNLSVSIH